MARIIAFLLASSVVLAADNPPDIFAVPADLAQPAITTGTPAAGKLVLEQLPQYAGTEVAHALYLPPGWKPGRRYPVLIEYHGNGRRVKDGGGLGFGLSGGQGYIWAVLPYVGPDHKTDMDKWWGDVEATVDYAKQAVAHIARRWGGDPKRVVLIGMSRGAIACNYIGLHDDAIARLWRGMIALSHYDDAHTAWGMTAEERALAPQRLRRLGSTPQLIAGEHHLSAKHSDQALLERIRQGGYKTFDDAKAKLGLIPMTESEQTRAFIAQHHLQARVTFIDLPYVNHTTDYVLRDIPERRQMREWLKRIAPPRR